MADNYLERRMEDLQSGRLQQNYRNGKSESVKGFLKLPFPSRRVLITGGTHGIGLSVVKAFLSADCKVAVFDKDKLTGKNLSEKIGFRFYPVDLSDTEATEKALDDLLHVWHDIDIVISNAGVSEFKNIIDCSTKEFKEILNVNLVPAFLIARKLAKHRSRLPYPNSFGGRFIIISSSRHIQSEAGTEAYSASKGALASLTHALMMSLSEFGITVNSISPGWINTANEELTEDDKLQHPSRRVGTPEDIARLCIFLSAPGNDFINGIDIPVDGGMTHKMIYI